MRRGVWCRLLAVAEMPHQEHLKKGHTFIGWDLRTTCDFGYWYQSTALYLGYNWRGQRVLIQERLHESSSEDHRKRRMERYLSPDAPVETAKSTFVPA